MSRGRFLTFEGGEGAGKSSNIRFAQTRLEARGIPCLVTREPGGTEVAEAIRQVLLSPHQEPVAPMTELLLVFAARAQHLAHCIQPALAQGTWVLCDRFTDTTYAYQGAGREMGAAPVAALEQLVQGTLRSPDRIESEQVAFFERIRASFKAQARQLPSRWRVIDAARPLPEVEQQVAAVLDAWLEDTHGQ